MPTTQRWSYFLIPLPDPVGLENGRVIRTIEHLEPVVDGAFSQNEDRIIASICIHQVESEFHEVNASYDYFDLAEKVWPSTSEPDETNKQYGLEGLTFTRTVAEVAITPLDEALRNHFNLDERDDLYHQFEIALNSVNSLLEEYRLIAKIPIRLATLELLPPFIPQAFGDVRLDSSRKPENFSLRMYLLSPHKLLVPEELTSEQSARLSSNLALSSQPHPLRRYASIRNDAAIAQRVHGDQRMAIILIATACEILINSVLQSVMWETDKALNSSAKNFHRQVPASKRIQKFSGYFGASWGLKTTPELIRWDEDIARVRNRVVHTGSHPEKNEVDRASAAMDGLLKLFKMRLENHVQQYPRTLSWLVGDQVQKLSPQSVQVILDARNRNEPNWVNLIENWSKAIEARNEKPHPELPLGPPRIVIYEDFSAGWIAADAGKTHACFVDPDCVREVMAEFTEMMKKSIKNLKIDYPNGLPEPLVLALEGAKVMESFEPTWVAIHEVDPMLNFSLDKHQVTRPPAEFTLTFS